MKFRIELFFTVMKLFWGVHAQVLAKIFAQRWAASLSERLFTEAIWDAEAALEYLDFLDENEPLDGAWVISDDGGSANSFPSDGGLEIRPLQKKSHEEFFPHELLMSFLMSYSWNTEFLMRIFVRNFRSS